ncbi:hypothetical protein Tco_1220113 [Tanacetum coccineum]
MMGQNKVEVVLYSLENYRHASGMSSVDVNNLLSKPVTPHYLPKVREYVLAKPHHVIAPSSSRNSSKESYGSNDMVHNYYLEEAKKKTQDKNMNLKPSVMHTTSLQNTTNGSEPKPRSNKQTSRSLPISKSSCGMSNGVPLVDHSRNSSSFLDSKHFVCSTCQKCVFNANHDACLTKFLKEVNSRIKVQSPKTRNNIKPVEKITNVIKPKRWISKGYRFSPNKSSAVHEKPNTPRSCLRWKPTGRIFKTAGLRWIPTGKMFTDCTTKVDSEPPNGSNEDITNPYECDQTLNVSACTLNLSADNTSGPAPQRKEKCTIQCALSSKEEKYSMIDDSGEAVEASKRRRSLLDHKIQQLFKSSSEGSVHDVSNDEENKAENTKLMQKLQRSWKCTNQFNSLLIRQHQHPHHQPHKLKFKCVRPLAGKTVQENLESFVSGRVRDIDYRLIQRTE